MKKLGIDVSTWQGNIDWEKVKASEIEFAILRCGYGMDQEDQDDPTFDKNAKECERLGIPYGVYFYSYATDVERAKSEAEHTIRLLKGRKLDYPVYLDLEEASIVAIGRQKILENVKVYTEVVEAAGYCVGVYANLNWWNNHLTNSWYDDHPRWVAQYYTECQYKKEYGMWQYSSSGSVPGISGNVDMNYAYVDYPQMINGSKDEGAAEPETPVTPTKSIDEIANEVIAGKWANGKDRVNKLTVAGYDANTVQDKVNELLKPKKSIEEIANEVIAGKWGNGQDRAKQLTKAGYNANTVQDKVNALLKANAFKSYSIKTTVPALNVRSGPGKNHSINTCIRDKNTYVIVEESSGTGSDKGWGKLKNGTGWISLDYVTKI